MLFHSTSFSLFLYNIVCHTSTWIICKYTYIFLDSHHYWRQKKKDFFFNLLFYWRIITLQNFVVFCQTSTWISQRYTYIPSLWTSLSSSTPAHPSRLIQNRCFEFPEPYSKFPLAIYIYIFLCFFKIYFY